MASSRLLSLTATVVNVAWWVVLAVFVIQIGFSVYGMISLDSTSAILAHVSLDVSELGLSIPVPLKSLDLPAIRKLSGMFFALGVVTAAFVFFVLNHVKGILRLALAGTPFVRESARRVRTIGLAILGWAAYSTLVQAVFGMFMAGHLTWPGVPIRAKVSPSIETIIFGLLMLVLAEVFRYGLVLQEEHDLTV